MTQRASTLHAVPTPTTPPAFVTAPVTASRRSWVAWLRGDDTITGELLLPAVLDAPSRDALLLYPHRGDWNENDPTQGRTWTLTQQEQHTLWRNGAPNSDLTGRVLDGLGKVLDESTTNDRQHAAALAGQAFLAWDAENPAAALLWTAEALQHDPRNTLAVMLDVALQTHLLPLWRS